MRAGRKERRGGSAGPDHACGSRLKDGQDEQGTRDTRCIPTLSAGEPGPSAETRRAKVSPTGGGWEGAF